MTDGGGFPCAWRLSPDANLQWRHWDDDETLIYHPPSGDTHCLNPLASATLSRITPAGVATGDLITAVLKELDLEATDQWQDEVRLCLELFYDLGMIEPADACQ